MPQTTMSIRVDSNLKQRFDTICDEVGLNTTSALVVFMKTVVRECRIPFEIRTDSEEEIRLKALLSFENMRKDAAKAGIQDLSLDEINEIIDEVRMRTKIKRK